MNKKEKQQYIDIIKPMLTQKRFEHSLNVSEEAVKLAKEIGTEKAAKELNVPSNTLYGWVNKAKVGGLDISLGERNPEDALNIAQENQQLKKKTNAMEKEIKRLNEMNEFLEDAAAFFAASRQKSGKSKD